MSKRKPLLAANWKMHGTLATIKPLLRAVRNGLADAADVELAVCAPFPYLALVQTELAGTGIAVAAQDLSPHDSGAFTGEVAGQMLRDFQCRYVIVGHSERRLLYSETDAVVAAKFDRALACDLRPILCFGECLEEREAGETEQVLARQLGAVLEKSGVAAFANAVIAYEPVWAIGTGKTATPAQAEDAHGFIRLQIARHDDAIADNLRILYGGSVKPENAADLFALADVDGGLVGGASLVADDFLAICRALS